MRRNRGVGVGVGDSEPTKPSAADRLTVMSFGTEAVPRRQAVERAAIRAAFGPPPREVDDLPGFGIERFGTGRDVGRPKRPEPTTFVLLVARDRYEEAKEAEARADAGCAGKELRRRAAVRCGVPTLVLSAVIGVPERTIRHWRRRARGVAQHEPILHRVIPRRPVHALSPETASAKERQ